ncbi:hypothetical protein L3Q82_002939 [Scortum barcoo]|uniref:Uncharacterized protein n=1 Tax=Scortum barcoo TaxID=214431 RepID=A0ACB8VW58_9TELE|nr:hypothetical protein L3Q82_002939 [Scortum barcoo]
MESRSVQRSPECQTSFDALKAGLTQAPSLAYADYSLLFLLYTEPADGEAVFTAAVELTPGEGDAVIGYIGKCIDDVVPRITVQTFPNQKPWVNGEVRAKLKARTDAYNSGDLEEYRKSRSMWAGLKTLTDYKKKISSAEVMSASLPDELNTFYARFESTSPAVEVQKAQEDHCPPVISRADVCRTLKRINTRKAPGPDGIPGRALKETIIVPVPKKTKILSLNDYRPVALTSTIMKCFERSTEDAIALTLHTALSHLDQRDTYVRMLFIDYSSAFNTIVPSKLVTKLRDLGLNSALCDWILNFLTGRPQAVRMGSTTSSTLTLNTGAPQGCVLSPLLYSLFTHDCVATHSSNTIIKFADDTTVIGLITGDDETAYREEVRALTSWCQDNNLQLNVSKTKELIVDFRRRQREEHAPLSINGTTVERVNSFRFLGVHISEDLTWTHHTDFITKSARQRLFFLRRLRRLNMDSRLLCSFYRCTIESILTGCITAWYSSCTALNRKALQRVVKAAQHITRTELPSMEDLYTQRCRKKATKIIKDPSHPSYKLFCLLPSGRRGKTKSPSFEICKGMMLAGIQLHLSMFLLPSLNRHLTEVEGFVCPNDPRSYVVEGHYAPGRVSHGKQVLGDGPD